MSVFTLEELKQRAFDRAAWVLKHYWEEQMDDIKREARVHSRLFDPLVPRVYIDLGKSKNGGGHIEPLVPCVVLRDLAFEMYWLNKTEKDVSNMLSRLLRVAHISSAEAHHLDHVCKLKTRMPEGWNYESGDVLARLNAAGIELANDSIPLINE